MKIEAIQHKLEEAIQVPTTKISNLTHDKAIYKLQQQRLKI